MPLTNEYGQPIGVAMPNWSVRPEPEDIMLTGRTCRIERLSLKHADDLYSAYSQASDGRDWTYLFVGSFDNAEEHRKYVETAARSSDPRHYVIIDLISDKAVGTAALMRINPLHGVIEVGCVSFSPLLKQSVLSTEAQYLLMSYVFDQLGYRRYEWKCDSLNAPSRKAAARLGFKFEGIFRQHMIYKGRNRDTAWFAIVDEEWPALKVAFQAWLIPENFDEEGKQIKSLRIMFRESKPPEEMKNVSVPNNYC